MFWNKKTNKLGFNIKRAPCVVWEDSNNRVICTNTKTLLTEEKFLLDGGFLWMHVPQKKTRENILETAFLSILNKIND